MKKKKKKITYSRSFSPIENLIKKKLGVDELPSEKMSLDEIMDMFDSYLSEDDLVKLKELHNGRK